MTSFEKKRKEPIAADVTSAQEALLHARQNPVKQNLILLKMAIQVGGLRPEDIGTTAQELAELDQRAIKARAEEALDYAKKIPNKLNLDVTKTALQDGNLTPEDIGTTAAELAELAELSEQERATRH